jgi:hypothetical protein
LATTRLQSYLDWYDTKFFHLTPSPRKCQAVLLPGRGRSLIAIDDIKEGDTILRIPFEATIDALKAIVFISKLHPAWGTIIAKEKREMILGFWLACELSRGDESEWVAWLSTFPQQKTNLYFWKESHFSFLPTSLITTFRTPYAELNQQIESLRTQLITVTSPSTQHTIPSANEIKWGVSQILSHAIQVDAGYQTLALVPWVDMCNHSNEETMIPQVERRKNYEKNRPKKRNQTNSNRTEYNILFIAEKHIPKGKEINIVYGSHSNEQLLSVWGFVLSHNPLDCITITINLTDQISTIHWPIIRNELEMKDVTTILHSMFPGDPLIQILKIRQQIRPPLSKSLIAFIKVAFVIPSHELSEIAIEVNRWCDIGNRKKDLVGEIEWNENEISYFDGMSIFGVDNDDSDDESQNSTSDISSFKCPAWSHLNGRYDTEAHDWAMYRILDEMAAIPLTDSYKSNGDTNEDEIIHWITEFNVERRKLLRNAIQILFE